MCLAPPHTRNIDAVKTKKVFVTKYLVKFYKTGSIVYELICVGFLVCLYHFGSSGILV